MSFCPRCGAKISGEARFCAACGATTQPQSERPRPIVMGANDDVSENKGYAILAYLWLLFLVPLLAAKDSPFARFHTNQGIWLFIGWGACSTLYYLPIIRWALAPLVSIGLLVFVIMGIVHAAQGEMRQLPLIDKLPKIIA